jgi:uncharacterized membrane protein
VVLVGVGFGSAFYLYCVNRSGNLPAIAVVVRYVVLADWMFTTPAVLLQPASGVALVHQAGWSLDTPWLLASGALYVLAGVCWIPVVWLQIRMKQMAELAVCDRTRLPDQYWRYAKLWERLGYPAFAAMLAVYVLMVNKPQW